MFDKRCTSRHIGPGLLLMVVCGLPVVAAQFAVAQTETVLYTFKGGTDGALPQAPPVLDVSTTNGYQGFPLMWLPS
jgi:hypothetical protein